ncbi:MAG: lysostaphin resistance A-like protein [Pseudomonadota bacterium]
MGAEPTTTPTRARGALAVALLGFAAVRLRGQWEPYVALHRWLREVGVPDAVRNLDGFAWMAMLAVATAAIAGGCRRTASTLGLTGSLRGGFGFAAIAALPMLAQGALASEGLRLDADALRGVAAAPLAEELLFRGALLAVAVRLAALPFWPCAIAFGALFGSMHVPWDGTLGAGHAGVLAATTAGGVWYGWLLRAHGWNLWTTIGLHAAMNAAWMVFTVADDAGGGLWANVGRGLTIALGTWRTLRRGRGGAD